MNLPKMPFCLRKHSVKRPVPTHEMDCPKMIEFQMYPKKSVSSDLAKNNCLAAP